MRNKFIKLLFTILTLIIFNLLACKKDKLLVSEPDIYLGGYFTNGPITQAAYWKNNEFHPVNNELLDSWGFGIVVDQSNVFLAGTYSGNACYWKNGMRNNLTDDTMNGVANAIAIKNGILYIIGFAKPINDLQAVDTAFLWIVEENGNITSKNLEANESLAFDLYLDGDNIYIAGSNLSKPCYWVYEINTNNKTRVGLGNGWGQADAITIYNSKVYCSGFYETIPTNPYYNCLWIDQQAVSKGTETFSKDLGFDASGKLVVVGGDYLSTDPVYIPRALYWQNEALIKQELSEKSSIAEAITFDGTATYIAGSDQASACYWKNGTLTLVGNIPSSVATDITLHRK